MGLVANVHCDCFEKGLLPPPPCGHVVKRGFEDRLTCPCDWDSAGLDANLVFDQWKWSSCEHELGKVCSLRIGNISLVGDLRAALLEHGPQFETILSYVLASGSDSGTVLPLELNAQIGIEADKMRNLFASTHELASYIVEFASQLEELLTHSNATGRPIVF